MIPDDQSVDNTIDQQDISSELDLVSELFHRINRVIPANQKLLTFPPEMTAREAITLLRQYGYSQVPVVMGEEVLRVFSYRSFAQKAAISTLQEVSQQKYAPGDIAVEECLERFEFARVTEEMRHVFAVMDRVYCPLPSKALKSSRSVLGLVRTRWATRVAQFCF